MKTTVLLRVATAILVTAYLMACQPSLMNEGLPSPSKSGRESADFLTDPRVAYGLSMEVETYTYRIVESYGNSASKAMTQVNAAPRLHRERIESRVFEDGSMEMNTEQLRPQQLDKLPTDQRKWQELGPHRTELRSGRAIFYDPSGRQISQRTVKTTGFAAQIQEARKAKGLSRDEPLKAIPPTGYPKVDAATIQKAIAESPGGTRQLGKHVVQLRQEKPTPESNEYVLTTFDTYHGRVLNSEVRDAATNKLLFRSANLYEKGEDGIKLVGIYSESYLDDAKTGVKAKEIRHQTIQNAQFVNNL